MIFLLDKQINRRAKLSVLVVKTARTMFIQTGPHHQMFQSVYRFLKCTVVFVKTQNMMFPSTGF